MKRTAIVSLVAALAISSFSASPSASITSTSVASASVVSASTTVASTIRTTGGTIRTTGATLKSAKKKSNAKKSSKKKSKKKSSKKANKKKNLGSPKTLTIQKKVTKLTFNQTGNILGGCNYQIDCPPLYYYSSAALTSGDANILYLNLTDNETKLNFGIANKRATMRFHVVFTPLPGNENMCSPYETDLTFYSVPRNDLAVQIQGETDKVLNTRVNGTKYSVSKKTTVHLTPYLYESSLGIDPTPVQFVVTNPKMFKKLKIENGTLIMKSKMKGSCKVSVWYNDNYVVLNLTFK